MNKTKGMDMHGTYVMRNKVTVDGLRLSLLNDIEHAGRTMTFELNIIARAVAVFLSVLFKVLIFSLRAL